LRTVGIDLAAQDKDTAVCEVTWKAGQANVASPAAGHDDDSLIDAICESDRAGIDSPFGWPQAFVEAVAAHQARERWPGAGKGLHELADARSGYRKRLSYRATDLAISADTELRLRPLSVSTDRIGVTTMRCVLLLDRLQHERRIKIDRSGASGRVAEVYPAAALSAWSLRYKGTREARRRSNAGSLSRRSVGDLEPASERRRGRPVRRATMPSTRSSPRSSPGRLRSGRRFRLAAASPGRPRLKAGSTSPACRYGRCGARTSRLRLSSEERALRSDAGRSSRRALAP